MLNIIRALLIGTGVYLGVQLYQNGDTDSKAPSVPSNVILEETLDVFPSPPQNALGAVLEPLEGILAGEPADSLVLARAYRDFAKLTARTPGAVTLGEYAQDYKNAIGILFMNTPMQGKYKDQVIITTDKAYQEVMKKFADSNGEYPDQTIDAAKRAALVEWLNACSGKFHEVYLKNLENAK